MSDDPQPAAQGGSFTGIKRQRKTRLGIKVTDIVARSCITVGGIGTICAVALVCIFLVIKVVPLFTSGTMEPAGPAVALGGIGGEPVRLAADEYRLMVAEVTPEGRLRVLRLDTGELLQDQVLFPDAQPTAWSFLSSSDSVAVGFADGGVRLGSIRFRTEFLTDDEVPPELAQLADGERATWQGGVIQRTPEGQLRRQVLATDFGEAIAVSPDAAILALDHFDGGDGAIFTSLDAGGTARIYRVDEKKNLLTGKVTYRTEEGVLPALDGDRGRPDHLVLTSLGDNVWMLWKDGSLARFDTRDLEDIFLAEILDVLPGEATVTAARFANGRSTLLVGDSEGRIGAWFRRQATAADEQRPPDGKILTRGHLLESASAPVTALGVSSRTRLIAAGHADGTVALFNVTTQDRVAMASADRIETDGVISIDVAPKDDGIIALAGGHLHFWHLDAPYHEVSPASLILPVHYESRIAPATIWQSSSGDDAFEPKYGLWPLVFGTLKATFYALVFGVPIALLAAIYTSEFLHPKAKATVKPVIELMASLPSVVLGFLAGIVIASWVEDRAAGVLLTVLMLPFALLLGARLWQLVPRSIALRVGGWRLLLMFPMAFVGVWLAGLLTAPVERLFFTVQTVDVATGETLYAVHDLKAWLSAHKPPTEGREYQSSGMAGWLFLLIPVAGLIIAGLNARFVSPWLRAIGDDWSELTMALVDLLRFLVNTVLVVLIAILLSLGLGWLLGDPRSSERIGWMLLCLLPVTGAAVLVHLKLVKPRLGDAGTPLWLVLGYVAAVLLGSWLLALGAIDTLGPLGSYLDTYIQRNALVVGFVMGFAIIPIIYTISEDALSSVPEHLRSASLGCGATKWQTALRVILPTAMSGVFSAIMIGLGRAVGETMIVLMAAGNTPVLSMNIFNGFRTLSANIAVELPEAPVDGTHYRVLFLAALVLFIMTFVLNTAAEAVRQRFRKRAYQL